MISNFGEKKSNFIFRNLKTNSLGTDIFVKNNDFSKINRAFKKRIQMLFVLNQF